MKNKFLQEMQKRGYLNQCTNLDKLNEICNKNSILDISFVVLPTFMLEVYCK